MSDPHLNIFHAYRGATPSGGDADVVRDRQLEDNLTRALLITLQAVRGSTAQQPLLRALGVPDAATGRTRRQGLGQHPVRRASPRRAAWRRLWSAHVHADRFHAARSC